MTRRAERFVQEVVVLQYDHAAEAATFAEKIFKAPRAMRIDSVEYVNPTGYTADAVNYYTLQVKTGANVAAEWDLVVGGEGTIAADTFVDFVLTSTDAYLVLAADTIISWTGTKVAGGVNVPIGRLIIHGRYI